MKEKEHQLVTGRRDALKMFGLVSAGLVTGGFRNYSSGHQQIQENIQKPLQGLPPVKI